MQGIHFSSLPNNLTFVKAMSADPQDDRKIWLYDTTLRDGSQAEGMSLSLEDKIRIACKLDELGIDFIEGGWPGANPKDVQFFWQMREVPLKHAQLVAFCSTRRPHRNASEEELLNAILAAGTHWMTIFGKSWDLHVTEGLKTTLDENLAMIGDTIAFLVAQGRRVSYDAEHWFDGYKQNPAYAIETLKVAIAAGAEWIVFCDTNGGVLPHEIQQITQEVFQALSVREANVRFGIHTHNDSETAVANALAGVLAGARMVQGTINGYGERCGNANLCSLIPNLQLKLGFDCLPGDRLQHLTDTSHFVSEAANLASDDRAPFVGRSAFAHKGGIHVSAVARNPLTYEHVSPETIGNQRRIVISDQAGLSNVLAKAQTFGIELDKQDPRCREILQRLKQLENEGFQFEAAEASFELLVRDAMGQRKTFFALKGFQVHCQTDGDARVGSLATVKVAVNDAEILEAAEGNGPVAALDAALRKALTNFYPELAAFHLVDYKVRILDSAAGTEAKTRVLVEFGDGRDRWTAVGVSTNIIDASYQAVAEGLEYGLLLQERAKVPAGSRSSQF